MKERKQGRKEGRIDIGWLSGSSYVGFTVL